MSETGGKRKGLSPDRRLELLLTRQGEVNPDVMLDDIELATLLNCSVQLLRIARSSGGKMKDHTKDLPPHQVLFGRLIRYRYGDVMAWLHDRGNHVTDGPPTGAGSPPSARK